MACHRRTTFSWRDKVALAFNYTPSRREIINWLRDGRDELSSRWEMRERFAPFYIQLDSWLHDLSVPKTRHCIDTHITFIKRIIFKKKKKSPKHPCDCGAARLYECEWRDLWASRGACVISFGHGESNEITPRRLYNSGRIIKKKDEERFLSLQIIESHFYWICIHRRPSVKPGGSFGTRKQRLIYLLFSE